MTKVSWIEPILELKLVKVYKNKDTNCSKQHKRKPLEFSQFFFQNNWCECTCEEKNIKKSFVVPLINDSFVKYVGNYLTRSVAKNDEINHH